MTLPRLKGLRPVREERFNLDKCKWGEQIFLMNEFSWPAKWIGV